MTEQQSGSFASPFHVEPPPEEPGEGAVIAWQRLGHDGATLLTYVSLRAGGRWYTTGKETLQGVAWSTLLRAIRQAAVGPVRVASAWADLDVPVAAFNAANAQAGIAASGSEYKRHTRIEGEGEGMPASWVGGMR